MIALMVIVSFSVVGLVALVHAIKNAPLIEERDDSGFGHSSNH